MARYVIHHQILQIQTNNKVDQWRYKGHDDPYYCCHGMQILNLAQKRAMFDLHALNELTWKQALHSVNKYF